MFPFDRPTNYDQVLNKIGIFTFLEGLLLTWIVSKYVPSIESILSLWTVEVDVFSLKMPILFAAPAGIIALGARIVRLHDKLSDTFRIRKSFDVQRVLTPLAGAVGVGVSPAFRDILAKERDSAMRWTFYEYASFEEPKISKAVVLSAIDLWTWYWVLLELLFLLMLSGTLLLYFGAYAPASFVMLGLVIGIPLFCSVFAVCGRKADYQIEEIVADSSRCEAVRAVFARLSGAKPQSDAV